MSNYEDPENYESILEEIKNAPTLREVHDIVKRVYPDWIVCLLDGFSKDYQHLDKNWRKVCVQMKVRPTKVMIVNNFEHNNDNMKLVNIFCEIFTKSGFSVKKSSEYIPCVNCQYAIPVPEVYDRFKNSRFSIPDKWKDVCSYNCNRKDSADISSN
jgi:hypothetical protein